MTSDKNSSVIHVDDSMTVCGLTATLVSKLILD